MNTPLDLEVLKYEPVININFIYDTEFIFPACAHRIDSISWVEGSSISELVVTINSIVIKNRGGEEYMVKVSIQEDLSKHFKKPSIFYAHINPNGIVYVISRLVKNFIKSVYHYVIYNDNDNDLPWSKSLDNKSHRNYIESFTTKLDDNYAFTLRLDDFSQFIVNYPCVHIEVYDDNGITPMVFCSTQIRKKISGLYHTARILGMESTSIGVEINDTIISKLKEHVLQEAIALLVNNDRDDNDQWGIDSNQND